MLYRRSYLDYPRIRINEYVYPMITLLMVRWQHVPWPFAAPPWLPPLQTSSQPLPFSHIATDFGFRPYQSEEFVGTHLRSVLQAHNDIRSLAFCQTGNIMQLGL